jgi:hypothetical protein
MAEDVLHQERKKNWSGIWWGFVIEWKSMLGYVERGLELYQGSVRIITRVTKRHVTNFLISDLFSTSSDSEGKKIILMIWDSRALQSDKYTFFWPISSQELVENSIMPSPDRVRLDFWERYVDNRGNLYSYEPPIICSTRFVDRTF